MTNPFQQVSLMRKLRKELRKKIGLQSFGLLSFQKIRLDTNLYFI